MLDNHRLVPFILFAACVTLLAFAEGGANRAAKTLAATPAASPEATPAASPEVAETNSVTTRGFNYRPDPIGIETGDAVTWTNEDIVRHTATARDRDVLQTGGLARGQSTTVTFETPRKFDYFCEYHTGMKGTIIVR